MSSCKYKSVIDRCTARGEAFYGCNPQFLNTMLMKLKLVFFMPNEEVFKKDDLSRELALVHYGACSIFEDDKVARVVRHDVSTASRWLHIHLNHLRRKSLWARLVEPSSARSRP